MSTKLKSVADHILSTSTGRAGGAPGVVALVTSKTENIYEGCSGVRSLGSEAPMTMDSVMAIFSTTKAITATAIMQLVEEGLLSLNDPAKKYVPEIAAIEVLTGYDSNDKASTRPPARDITVLDLMTHTAGFCYEFFSHEDLKYRTEKEIPTVVSSTFASICTVLLHDPGERWTYGVNIDWLGLIVEKIRGKRLGIVFEERIFGPLGMSDISFTLSESMKQRRAILHDRAQDGKLTPLPDLILPQPPEMDMGGHGLYASVGEYAKFIRMFLNDGNGPHGRVLKAETVEAMSKNMLPQDVKSGGWITSIPSLSNAGEFDPGVEKTWALSFQRNEEACASGRPAGSLMWAGLGNLYYWIDRKNSIGGFWGSQILPFQDIASYPGFVEFETAVYRYR